MCTSSPQHRSCTTSIYTHLLPSMNGRHGAPSLQDSAVRAPASGGATDGGAPGHPGHTACRTRGTRRSPTSDRPSGRQRTMTNVTVNGVLPRGSLERPAGIEPALSPWKGDVPPQHFGRSLLLPASRFHSAVVPRSYRGMSYCLEGRSSVGCRSLAPCHPA